MAVQINHNLLPLNVVGFAPLVNVAQPVSLAEETDTFQFFNEQHEASTSSSANLGNGVSVKNESQVTVLAGTDTNFKSDDSSTSLGGETGYRVTASNETTFDLGPASVKGKATVKDGAAANADVDLKHSDGDYSAAVDGGAFMGPHASVDGEVSADAGPVSGTAGAGVSTGFGADAGAKAGIEDGKLVLGLSGEAAAGVGLGFDVEVEFDINAFNKIMKIASYQSARPWESKYGEFAEEYIDRWAEENGAEDYVDDIFDFVKSSDTSIYAEDLVNEAQSIARQAKAIENWASNAWDDAKDWGENAWNDVEDFFGF